MTELREILAGFSVNWERDPSSRTFDEAETQINNYIYKAVLELLPEPFADANTADSKIKEYWDGNLGPLYDKPTAMREAKGAYNQALTDIRTKAKRKFKGE